MDLERTSSVYSSMLFDQRAFQKSDRMICVLKSIIKSQKFFAILFNIPIRNVYSSRKPSLGNPNFVRSPGSSFSLFLYKFIDIIAFSVHRFIKDTLASI